MLSRAVEVAGEPAFCISGEFYFEVSGFSRTSERIDSSYCMVGVTGYNSLGRRVNTVAKTNEDEEGSMACYLTFSLGRCTAGSEFATVKAASRNKHHNVQSLPWHGLSTVSGPSDNRKKTESPGLSH